MDGYEALMSAVLKQTIIDYINSLIEIRKKHYVHSDCLYLRPIKAFEVVAECEEFFNSPLFVLYSKVNGEVLKQKCKELAKKKDNYIVGRVFV